jgi:hypothetical protein
MANMLGRPAICCGTPGASVSFQFGTLSLVHSTSTPLGASRLILCPQLIRRTPPGRRLRAGIVERLVAEVNDGRGEA